MSPVDNLTRREKELNHLFWKQDRRRIDRLAFNHGVIPKDSQELLLWVSNDYFTAGAVWKRIFGVWSCIKAAPIIKWMVGMNKDKAKLELLRKGCTYQWIYPGVNCKSGIVAQSKSTSPLVGEKGRCETNTRINNPSALAGIARDGGLAGNGPAFTSETADSLSLQTARHGKLDGQPVAEK